jgi:hypothetical protein
MSEPIEPMGAWMRKQAEANGNCTSQAGALFLHLTRDGHDWALELNHEKPISSELAQHWAVECGAPGGTACYKAYGGKVWRFEWIDNKEEVAAQRAETVAFYLHGTHP